MNQSGQVEALKSFTLGLILIILGGIFITISLTLNPQKLSNATNFGLVFSGATFIVVGAFMIFNSTS